ncbi:MAG: hypothetical protein KUG79_01820 [Pseudomonadales bacterium]|nr:hypothetical protein [Pseudomonadales bacterium]
MSLESIQIIKCVVCNPESQQSNRLIEKDNYDLWRYLVTTKHNITIVESTLALWITQSEFTQKQAIYQRAGQIEAANRLMLTMYDDDGNFSNTCRFVLDSETAEVESILLRHIPKEQRLNQQYSLVIEPGQLVTRGPLSQLSLSEKALDFELE